MAAIIIGTTPTITYTFKTIEASEVVTAYLTIKQGSTTVIERTLDTATVTEEGISWTFTQAETLALSTGKASVMLNWLTRDGTRGASQTREIKILDNHKQEVI